jgi:cbb3-type cytochrome oxidase maturation protein
MNVLLLLIPLSVVMAAAFTVACVRAIRQGQFDDLESPKWRILFEDRGNVDKDQPLAAQTRRSEPA